jgi:hypothetical protein
MQPPRKTRAIGRKAKRIVERELVKSEGSGDIGPYFDVERN